MPLRPALPPLASLLLASLLLSWAVAAPAAAQTLPLHGAPVRALAVAPDGSVASGGFDQAVILWPPDLSAPRAVTRWHQGAVQALAPLPGGGFASAGEDGRIALWPALPGPEPERVLEGHDGAIAALAARPGLLLSAGWDGTARLWPLSGDAAPRILEGHQGQVTGAAFRADGLPVTAGADGTLRGWPAEGPPQLLGQFGLPQTALLALPGGTLASAGVDGVVRLTSSSGAPRHLEAGRSPVTALAASADGALLAATGPAGGIFLWSLPEGRLRHSLASAGQALWALAFSPDGSLLYAAGADRRLRAYDTARGIALGAEPPPPATPRQAGLDMEGARVFRACGACHSLTAPPAGQPDLKAGPHLGNLFGRRMGALPGYAYSERLSRGDIVWTKESVADLFTRGPDIVTPGTRMPVQIVGDPEDMAALLRFLEQATRQ